MAINVAAGSIVECTIQGRLFGSTVINTFHYRAIDAVADAAADLAAALADFESKVWNQIRTIQSTDLTGVILTIQPVHPVRYVRSTLTPVSTGGSVASVSAPAGVAAVWRRKSELAGHSHRGRVYLAGIPNASISNGLIAPLTFANMIAAASASLLAVLNNAAAASWLTPVIWSYSDANNSDAVFTTAVDPFIRYQRRRETDKGV